MHRTRPLAGIAAALVLLLPPDARAQQDPAAQVRAIADAYVAEVTARFPGTEEALGASRSPDRWSLSTPAQLREWEGRQDAFLAQLEAVDEDALFGKPEWLIHGMLRESLVSSRAQRVCRSELWGNVDQIFGWHLGVSQAAVEQRVGTAEHRARALSRFRQIPAFAAVEIANAREGLRLGYTAPRVNVERVIEQIGGMLPDDVTQSPFWSPAQRDSAPGFAGEWRAVIADSIYPALRRYRDFLQSEYLPKARTESGLHAIPNGRECYRGIVRAYTSLDIDPRELAAAGRAARAGLEAEMQPLAAQLTGEADLRRARVRLKTAPEFTFGSREAKLSATRAQLDSIRAVLPRAFSRVPTTPLVVEPAPSFQERSSPPAWYDRAPLDGSRPGTFYINLHNAERAPRMDLATATTHEGWPGHHMQIAWIQEREPVHPIMRLLGTSAFSEGWGMYAERLAYEMDIFSDDLQRTGLLSHLSDALVALEIDPGMHVDGWTRQQAVDSMTTISGRPQAQAEVYADRHAATPGQMVSYMTGYLEIVRLREQARRELGAAFDLREFHDVVLDDGAVTLPMLRAKVERWIATKKSGA